VSYDIENMLEISFSENDDFLKIRETLTRIGVASRKDRTLYQSCHILHKRGKYYLVHFKELFALDGKDSSINDNDIARRNAIARLLEEWKLLKIVDTVKASTPLAPMSQIKVLPHKEKDEWKLVAKYNIGATNK
tara:strand:+ start:23401 stop:23802 length:402 start_codon:yes stop_codon:yes gene_type:complete